MITIMNVLAGRNLNLSPPYAFIQNREGTFFFLVYSSGSNLDRLRPSPYFSVSEKRSTFWQSTRSESHHRNICFCRRTRNTKKQFVYEISMDLDNAKAEHGIIEMLSEGFCVLVLGMRVKSELSLARLLGSVARISNKIMLHHSKI